MNQSNPSNIILVGADRDNTINMDCDGFYGKDDDWRENLRFVPGSVDGLKELSEIPYVYLAVLTAQVGVAKGLISEERVKDMHDEMDKRLRNGGVKINSWQYCPYVDESHARKWEGNNIKTINYDYILPANDERLQLMKPKDGLLKRAAADLGLDYNSVQKCVIGDRATDVLCGLNAGGFGILVDSPHIKRTPGAYDSIDLVKEMAADPHLKGRVYIVESMHDAANIVRSKLVYD